MQQAEIKKLRKSVRIRPADMAKLKGWAAEFHTKEEAAIAFVGKTSFYLRALGRLLKNESGREDVVDRALEIIKDYKPKKAK